MTCGSLDNQIRQKLQYVIVNNLNQVIAPSKQEKYNLNPNSLLHLQLQQSALFFEENRHNVKAFVAQKIGAEQKSNENSVQESASV